MLHFFKKIEETIYLRIYIREKNVTEFLASILTSTDKKLTLETTLSELPEIFGRKNDWEKILIERLKIAPAKKIAIEKMIEELTSYIQFDESLPNEKISNEIYYNQYRKVAYNHYSRGDNVTMLRLGYLLLKEEWKQNKQGEFPEEEFVKITTIPFEGYKHVLQALVDGATIAVFLPYLEKLLPNVDSESVVNKTTFQKVKWDGELKEFAELIDQLEKNKWIEISHGTLSPFVQALSKCFDFSSRKKTETSKVENSLLQYLKPSERDNKIYTKRYKSKFDKIENNPKN